MGPLVIWWLVLEGLGLIALPLTARLFSDRAGHGYGFTKIIALLLVSYVAWLMAHLGVSVSASLTLTLAAFALLNLSLAWVDRERLAAWLRDGGLRTVLLQEALWTAAFLFFAWQRSLYPQIVDQEKYMDFAFFNSLQRTEVMPPQDPWMSGETFNYYYFGYLMLANLARLTGFPAPFSYNLCVATIAALAFSQLAAIGMTITRRLPLALLTGAMGILFGNLDGFLQLLEKGGLTQFDYFRSTRIVGKDATINEFPYFTAIHGDLHPHFLVMPVTLLFVALLLDPQRLRVVSDRSAKLMERIWPCLPLAFVLGSMVVISTWELPVGTLVLYLLLGRYLPLRPLLSRQRIEVTVAVGVIAVVGYIFYLPFYLHFVAPSYGGVGVKFATTSLFEFLTVFGGLLVPPAFMLAAEVGPRLSLSAEQRQLLGAGLAMLVLVAFLAGNAVFIVMTLLATGAFVSAYGTDDLERRAVFLLMLAGSLALLGCELAYIKDPYGEKLYRMNTVFKLYLQAWFLLSIAGPWCIKELAQRVTLAPAVRWVALGMIGAGLLASCAYPIGVTATRATYRGDSQGLNGNEYLRREHPDDFAAIQWLRDNVKGLPVLLEATGNPYSYFARFSSNTGLPTVMGWANHEGLWRTHDSSVGTRTQEVERMYAAPTLDEAKPLLDRYQIKYVVVGEIERKKYKGPALDKFSQLEVVFSQGATTIYAR